MKLSRRGSNQYRRRKQPIISAKMIAQIYFAIVICCISAGMYGKSNQQVKSYLSPVAHAQTVGVKHSTKVEALRLTPTVTPTPYKYDVQGAIKRIWGKDAATGIAIASCESGLRTNAYNMNTNGTIDFSVFQVNTIHGTILDPEENIRFAYSLFQEQGLDPWYSSKHCWESKL